MKSSLGFVLLCAWLLPAQSGIGNTFAEKTRILFQGDSITDGNRGRSGDTVADLANRWATDTIALTPDILSILVGINDQDRHGTVEQFEAQCDRLLADTVKALPNIRLVLGEPFSLRVGRYDNNRWDERLAELQAIVARLAAKYHVALVHYQKAFEDAWRRAPADYEWLRTVDQFWSTNK